MKTDENKEKMTSQQNYELKQRYITTTVTKRELKISDCNDFVNYIKLRRNKTTEETKHGRSVKKLHL